MVGCTIKKWWFSHSAFPFIADIILCIRTAIALFYTIVFNCIYWQLLINVEGISYGKERNCSGVYG